jgi:hypothetical protein
MESSPRPEAHCRGHFAQRATWGPVHRRVVILHSQPWGVQSTGQWSSSKDHDVESSLQANRYAYR